MYYRFSNILKIIQKPLNELHTPFKSNTPTQKCNVEVIQLGPVYRYRHRRRVRHTQSPPKFNIVPMESSDRLMDRMGSEPNLSIKQSITIHTM